jgi:hypothetical protein
MYALYDPGSLNALASVSVLFGATERSVHATVAATSRALRKRVLRAVGNISLSNFIGRLCETVAASAASDWMPDTGAIVRNPR